MSEMIVADGVRHAEEIRAIYRDYLDYAVPVVNREYGTRFNIDEMIEQDMQSLYKFMPPRGCLLLSRAAEQVTGLLCLKPLDGAAGELKRMFVRPSFRRLGIGRALVQQAFTQAKAMGYTSIYLDSARFMTDAHALYASMGFEEISPYAGSEIPVEFHQHWKFMRIDLI